MSEDLPVSLSMEVKVSRNEKHTLSQRDINGIGPGGFAAVLIGSRLLKGPRWVLVPASSLRPGGQSEKELCEAGSDVLPFLLEKLNRWWSNWILDECVWKKLFQQDHTKIKDAIRWCLDNHPPRENRGVGALREMKLVEALARFRATLDEALPNGAQQEGFIHQYLIAEALKRIGYQVTVNPVGVPDITAQRAT